MISSIKKFFLPKDREISQNVIRLALPVIISNLSRVLMSVVDVAMVGPHCDPNISFQETGTEKT